MIRDDLFRKVVGTLMSLIIRLIQKSMSSCEPSVEGEGNPPSLYPRGFHSKRHQQERHHDQDSTHTRQMGTALAQAVRMVSSINKPSTDPVDVFGWTEYPGGCS